MSGLTQSMAELIGMMLQSLLFGLYVALSLACLLILFRKQRSPGHGRPVNKTLVVITVSLFLLISSHWGVCFARIFRAFTYYATQEGGSDAYLEFAATPLYVAKTGLYNALTFVGDVTMVYRLYIVWARSWRIIIIPVMTTATLLVSGIAVTYLFATLPEGQSIFTGAISRWIIVVFVTSLSTNLTVTALITFRIWSINRRVQGPLRNSLMPIAVIVVESAILYTVFLMTTEGLFIAKANFQFITLDMTSPIIGIAFSFIIVRAASGRGLTLQSRSSRTPGRSTNWTRSTGLSQLEVNISTAVEVDNMYSTSLALDETTSTKPPDLQDIPAIELVRKV